MGQVTKAIAVVLLLASVAAAETFIAWDPSRHTPNARVLGLGRAYVGLADDTAAVYTNPAGLADRETWEFCSMSGKFLDEYSYYSATGYYPLPLGVAGIGFAGSSISGAYVTKVKEGSDPDDPIYEIDYSQPAVSNSNNVFVFSYGAGLDKLANVLHYQHPALENIDLGINAKIFNTSLVGGNIIDGTATGNELDLGIQYKAPWPYLKLGMSMQNILPFSMGGKLKYANGHEEGYPAVIESGLALNILGKTGSIIKFPQELLMVYDFDYYPTLSKYPLAHHAGLEWKPLDLLALRVGFDQDIEGDGTGGMTATTNLTAGAGFYYGGFRFDYAYMEFKSAPGTANHYFSLSYAPPLKPSMTGKSYLKIARPADKSLTFDQDQQVKGEIVDLEVKRVFINRAELKLDGKLTFEAEVSSEIGKNKIQVEGYDERGRLKSPLETRLIRVLRLRPFSDVKSDYWAARPVSLLAMAGIIAGYPNGKFNPEGNITRAEMCVLLMKSTTAEAAATTIQFSDVPEQHWATGFIAQAAALGYVKGYPGNLFQPNGNITRTEGVAMVARFAGIGEEMYLNEFSDLPSTNWAARIVAGANRAGILDYLKGKRFEPNKALTRAEVAEMLSKTVKVQNILKSDLLNWETY